MVKLTEDMIVARTRVSDLGGVKKLNCWGADIDDVSVLKKCHNVEMLSLSLNSIDSLSDFQHCKKLQELFLRKNHINSLRELLWLKDLGRLKNLWLAENPCSEGNENHYRQTVIHNLPQLEKLDNIAISSQERAEALRFGEGVGEADQDDGDSLADYNRRMSIEELEDLRSEHGENNHVQQDDEEDYQRRFSSVSGPDDNQDTVGCEYNLGSRYQQTQQHSSQYQQQQQHYQQEERTSLMQQSNSLLRTGSSGRMSVSSYNPGSEMALMSRHQQEMVNNNQRPQQRTSYFDDTRSSVSEYRPAPSGQFRSPGSVYSISGSGPMGFRGERSGHGPDLGRHSALQRPQRSRNSNILSSILCLIKEIDIPSLEVVEVAVRCRMEELDD